MDIVTADNKRVNVGDQVVYDQTLEYVKIKHVDPTQWAECVNGRGEKLMLNGLRMLAKVRPLGQGFVEIEA
jgi:hypothetical protein